VTNAPLETIDLVAACFRFAAEGEVGAGGSDGGVRVPLADIVMVKRAVRDARAMSSAWNALRAAGVVASVSPSLTFPTNKERVSRLVTSEDYDWDGMLSNITRKVVMSDCWGAMQ
jgi:hypothetical protein